MHATLAVSGEQQARRPWLERLLAATLVFNLLDIVLTLTVVVLGIAVEANPLMARVLDVGPVPFALLKLGIVSAGVWVLFHHRHHRLASVGTCAVFTAYAALMVWHMQSIPLLLL